MSQGAASGPGGAGLTIVRIGLPEPTLLADVTALSGAIDGHGSRGAPVAAVEQSCV